MSRRPAGPIAALLLLLACVLPATADGGFFPPDRPDAPDVQSLSEPEQLAVITFDGTRQTMALRVQYDGPLEEFAWVLPTPARPDVDLETGDPFTECETVIHRLMKARYEWLKSQPKPKHVPGTFGKTEGADPVVPRPVRVLEAKVVGDYQIAVLEADDAQALHAWLRANRYKLPESALPVLDHYVKQKWNFTAVKVRAQPGSLALRPLRIAFDSPRPVFPLRISSVNSGVTDVRIFLWTLSGAAKEGEDPTERPWQPLLNVRDHVDFSPTVKPGKWTFREHMGRGSLATADPGALDACRSNRADAPAFFKAGETTGVSLVAYEGVFCSATMTTDLWFYDARATGWAEPGSLYESEMWFDPSLPGGSELAAGLSRALADKRPAAQAAALRFAASFHKLDRLPAAEREALLELALASLGSKDSTLQVAAERVLVDLDRSGRMGVLGSAEWLKIQLPVSELLTPGRTPVAVLNRMLEMSGEQSFPIQADWSKFGMQNMINLRTLSGCAETLALVERLAAGRSPGPAAAARLKDLLSRILEGASAAREWVNQPAANRSMITGEFRTILDGFDTVARLTRDKAIQGKAAGLVTAWAVRAGECFAKTDVIRIPWMIEDYQDMKRDPRIPAEALAGSEGPLTAMCEKAVLTAPHPKEATYQRYQRYRVACWVLDRSKNASALEGARRTLKEIASTSPAAGESERAREISGR